MIILTTLHVVIYTLAITVTIDWCLMLLLDGVWLPVYVKTGRNVQRHECLQHNHGRVQAACSALWGTALYLLTTLMDTTVKIVLIVGSIQ